MKKSLRAAAVFGAAVVVGGQSVRAALVGFSGFAPVNSSGAPTGSPIGYAAGGSTFELTDGGGGEATTGFASTPQAIGAFTTTFTYTVPGGNSGSYGQADGFNFVLQNSTAGTAALGNGGGSRGYSGTVVTPSLAIGVELYGGSTETVQTNGSTSSIGSSSIGNLNTGNPIQFTINYSGTNLAVSTTDLTTKTTTYHTYTGVNLASTLGSGTALVGFSGGTGGVASTQTISNFQFKSTAGMAFTPIALTAGSFTQDGVVEAAAGATPLAAVTATMDSGTAKTGDAWFEKGAVGAPAGTGLPTSGSIFTSANDTSHAFQLQSYTGNNVLLLDTVTPTGTATFATPATLSDLSLLVAAGNGPAPITATINYADGAAASTIVGIVSPDWFSGQATAASLAGSRVNVVNGAYDGAGINPNLYQLDVPLPDSVDPISSVTFAYTGTNTGTQVELFALSGVAAPVPEPTTLGLVAAGAASLIGRRRRRA